MTKFTCADVNECDLSPDEDDECDVEIMLGTNTLLYRNNDSHKPVLYEEPKVKNALQAAARRHHVLKISPNLRHLNIPAFEIIRPYKFTFGTPPTRTLIATTPPDESKKINTVAFPQFRDEYGRGWEDFLPRESSEWATRRPKPSPSTDACIEAVHAAYLGALFGDKVLLAQVTRVTCVAYISRTADKNIYAFFEDKLGRFPLTSDEVLWYMTRGLDAPVIHGQSSAQTLAVRGIIDQLKLALEAFGRIFGCPIDGRKPPRHIPHRSLSIPSLRYTFLLSSKSPSNPNLAHFALATTSRLSRLGAAENSVIKSDVASVKIKVYDHLNKTAGKSMGEVKLEQGVRSVARGRGAKLAIADTSAIIKIIGSRREAVALWDLAMDPESGVAGRFRAHEVARMSEYLASRPRTTANSDQ